MYNFYDNRFVYKYHRRKFMSAIFLNIYDGGNLSNRDFGIIQDISQKRQK